MFPLSRNYRSTGTILSGAASLMEREKPLEGATEQGELIHVAPCRTHLEEAEMIVEQIERLMGGTTTFSLDSGRVSSHEGGGDLGFGDIGVLFRLNVQGDALQEAFFRAGIPFIRSGERPLISRHPVHILWRFFQVIRHPDHPYYRSAYLSGLTEREGHGPGKRGGEGEDERDILERGGSLQRTWAEEVFPVSDLIDRSVALHRFQDLTEDSLDALRHFKEIASGFGTDLSGFMDALSLDRGIPTPQGWSTEAY